MNAGSRDRHWDIVIRWSQYGAEWRTNLLRTLAILVFYSVELANFHGINLGPIQWEPLGTLTARDHSAISWTVVLWLAFAAGLFLCLKGRYFPRWLVFLSVSVDVILLSVVLIVRDGAASPLVVAYFVVIAMTALRFSLGLIRYATALTCFCYLFLLGAAKWYGLGEIVPRYQQAITLLALVLAGLVLGQVIRLVRSLGDEYAERMAEKSGRPKNDNAGVER